MEPYLDPTSDKVYCSECNKEITNITYFAKSQMKASKQFKKKQSNSFSVKCKSCNNEDRPILEKNELFCNSCKKKIDGLSPIFKKMLIEKLKNFNSDI
jgi:hypothetical protein